MKSYLTTLDFTVCFGECDHVAGQQPPGTPEAVVGNAENLSLNVDHELGTYRQYRVQLRTEAEMPDGLCEDLEGLFNHLPDYSCMSVVTEPIAIDSDLSKFTLCCHFRSGVPFETLKAGFAKHVAVGNLVGNGTVPQEYVAHVEIEADLPDGLTEAVHEVLKKAFDADTDESAINFQPINTSLVR